MSAFGGTGRLQSTQAQLARVVTEMQRGAYIEPDKITLAQFLERWLAHIKTQVEPGTYDRYFQFCRNNIIPTLGAARLTKLRPEQISDAYSKALAGGRCDGKEGGLSARTVKHMHTILKQALTQACVWRAISHNPAALVKPPKVARKEMRTLDTDATAKIIESARESPYLFQSCSAFCADCVAAKYALCVGARLIWMADDY